MRADSRWIIPLPQCTQSELCGDKAWRLSQMANLGYATPPGHVLLEPLRQSHLQRAGLAAAVTELEQLFPIIKTDDLLRRSTAIRAAIIDTAIDPNLHTTLAELYRQHWQGKTLVVRSSAHGEDSANHSFAGQLDSFLGIQSPDELEAAIRRTWASLWSPRCVMYQHHNGMVLKQMGVIVQEQVDARFSGVLFTKPPAGQTRSPVLLAEYCSGLADALVLGELTPGQILFDRQDGHIVQHIAPPESRPDVDILTQHKALKELAQGALAIEREFGAPLDIEWSIGRDGALHFLQARPITTATHGETNGVVWTNANIAENFPEPITPFLYSIVSKGYTAYFRNLGSGFGIARKRIAAMEDALDHVVGVHGGRLYYNLTNIHTLLYLAPGGRWLTSFFNEFVGATEFPVPRHEAAKLGLLERLIELTRIPIKVAWQYLMVKRRVGEFESRIDDFCRTTRRTDLPRKSLAELREDLRRFLDIRLHHWNNAALADTAAMICYGSLKLMLTRALPGKDGASLHNDLLKGLADVASNTPVLKLWELSRRVLDTPSLQRLFVDHAPETIWRHFEQPEFAGFRKAFLEYLEQWGFRSSGELMLTAPSPQEHPLETLALLKVYVSRSGPSPAELLRKQTAARETLTESVLAEITPPTWLRSLPFLNRAWWTRQLLRATHGAIRLRERARFRQARFYVHLRHLLLAIGDRLRQAGAIDAPEDLFFLTYEELDDLLSGHAMFPDSVRSLVTQRRGWHRELTKLTPPDHFVMPSGCYLPQQFNYPLDNSELRFAAGRLQGTAACGGRVTANATVLGSAAEGHTLQEGDILVTRQTDPGWASVFFLVRGLVVERGGMLSHGAIIAREYGIPAIVGVTGATQTIRTGNRLSLDGDQGVVDILC